MSLPPRGSVHPLSATIVLDSAAIDGGSAEDKAAMSRCWQLRDFILTRSVADELLHPHTPDGTRNVIYGGRLIVSAQHINEENQKILSNIREILGGDASSGKHDADAQHVYNAHHAWCDAFVTPDKRILAKRAEIYRIPGFRQVLIISPVELLEWIETERWSGSV